MVLALSIFNVSLAEFFYQQGIYISPPKAESSLTDSSQISSNSFIFAQTIRVVVLFHASSTMTFFIVVVVVVVAAADVAGGSWLVFFAENYFLLPKSSPSDKKLNEI